MRAALFGRLSTVALLLGDWRVNVNASLVEVCFIYPTATTPPAHVDTAFTIIRPLTSQDGSTALRLAAVGRHAQATCLLLIDPRQSRSLRAAEVTAITSLSGLCPDLHPEELKSAGFQL